MKHGLEQFIKNATAFIEAETSKDAAKSMLTKAKDSLEALDIGQAKATINIVLKQLEQLKTNITKELKDLTEEAQELSVGDKCVAKPTATSDWYDCIFLGKVGESTYRVMELNSTNVFFWGYIKEGKK